MSAQNSPALAGQIEHQGNHHTAALKPCPFCGNAKTPELVSAAELYCESQEELDSWPHSDSYAVICNASKPRGPGGCGATGGFCPSERLAMQGWNKRVPNLGTTPS